MYNVNYTIKQKLFLSVKMRRLQNLIGHKDPKSNQYIIHTIHQSQAMYNVNYTIKQKLLLSVKRRLQNLIGHKDPKSNQYNYGSACALSLSVHHITNTE